METPFYATIAYLVIGFTFELVTSVVASYAVLLVLMNKEPIPQFATYEMLRTVFIWDHSTKPKRVFIVLVAITMMIAGSVIFAPTWPVRMRKFFKG